MFRYSKRPLISKSREKQTGAPRSIQGCISLTLPTFQVAENFALPAATASSSLRFTAPLLHCWQPSIFGCWPSGVELPATGGYVGTASGDIQHSTQDVPVYLIMS